MARQRINFVDAVAVSIPRLARARTAVLAFGKVTAVDPVFATVQVGEGEVHAGYHTNYTPVAGDIVSLINDRDAWLVIGKMVNATWVGSS